MARNIPPRIWLPDAPAAKKKDKKLDHLIPNPVGTHVLLSTKVQIDAEDAQRGARSPESNIEAHRVLESPNNHNGSREMPG